MLVARSKAPLAELTEELTSAGHDVAYTTGDVSDPADVAAFVDATVARFGGSTGRSTTPRSPGAGASTRSPKRTSTGSWPST